jgi:hypothetical protein
MNELKGQINEMTTIASQMIYDGIQSLKIQRGDNIYRISQHTTLNDEMEEIHFVRITRWKEGEIFIRPFSKGQINFLINDGWIVNCEPRWRYGEARRRIAKITCPQ